MDSIPEKVGIVSWVKIARKRAGLTQEALAKQLGVSQSCVSRMEDQDPMDLTCREVATVSTVLTQHLHHLGVEDITEAQKKLECHKNQVKYYEHILKHLAEGGTLCLWCGAPFVEDRSIDGWSRCSSCGGN